MNTKQEIDFSEDLHFSLNKDSNNILIEFFNGNKLRISYDLFIAIKKFLEQENEK